MFGGGVGARRVPGGSGEMMPVEFGSSVGVSGEKIGIGTAVGTGAGVSVGTSGDGEGRSTSPADSVEARLRAEDAAASEASDLARSEVGVRICASVNRRPARSSCGVGRTYGEPGVEGEVVGGGSVGVLGMWIVGAVTSPSASLRWNSASSWRRSASSSPAATC